MTTAESYAGTQPGTTAHAAATRPGPATDPTRLTPVVFSTQGVEPRHQLDLWRSTYESFIALRPLDEAAEGFDGCTKIWLFGGMALMRSSAPAMSFERTIRSIRRDAIDHWVIRVARGGRSRMRIGDATFQMDPAQPLLFTLGQPHEGDRSEADWISLYIPRDSFADLSAGLGQLGNRVLDTPGAGLLAEYLTMLERRMPWTTLAELPVLVEGTRAMVAACLLQNAGGLTEARRDAEVTRLERIRCVLRQNIGSPTLGPEKLCRLAGVSRSQLYRLFEPHGGVARYIQVQRLRRAHAMLGDPGCRLTVAAIAERVGHFDASAFSRAFRQEFGYTPSEARTAFGGRLPGTSKSAIFDATDFVGVLRHLGAAGGTERSPA